MPPLRQARAWLGATHHSLCDCHLCLHLPQFTCSPLAWKGMFAFNYFIVVSTLLAGLGAGGYASVLALVKSIDKYRWGQGWMCCPSSQCCGGRVCQLGLIIRQMAIPGLGRAWTDSVDSQAYHDGAACMFSIHFEKGGFSLLVTSCAH